MARAALALLACCAAGEAIDKRRSESLISSSELSESGEVSKALTDSVSESQDVHDSMFAQVRAGMRACRGGGGEGGAGAQAEQGRGQRPQVVADLSACSAGGLVGPTRQGWPMVGWGLGVAGGLVQVCKPVCLGTASPGDVAPGY